MFNSVNNPTRINSLIEKLRHRLKSFAVLDQQGEKLGEVTDIILDANRQLAIVVSQSANGTNSPLFLLTSKLINKIEPANKTLLVNINKAQISNFNEYVKPVPDAKLAESNNAITSASVSISEIPIADADSLLNDTSPASEGTDSPSTPLFEVSNMQNEVQGTNLEAAEDTVVLNEVQDTNLESSQEVEVLGEEIIRLLGERVVVERNKRKVGEVIVRKEVETRMVQVPVRYEKLIVEQVSPEHKQLAEINLGQETINQNDIPVAAITEAQSITNNEISGTANVGAKATSLDGELTVSGNFNSPKIASLLLNAIALERDHGCKQVRVEIAVEDAQRQKTYQEWFNRSSSSG